MVITQARIKKGTESTLSELYVNNERFRVGSKGVYTLEDTDRGLHAAMSVDRLLTLKKKGRTAIPYNVPGLSTFAYRVGITWSNKFNSIWPELLNVPAYSGIRPHAGNFIADTEGCPLIGIHPDQDKAGYFRVWDSRNTFAVLKEMIMTELQAGRSVTWIISQKY